MGETISSAAKGGDEAGPRGGAAYPGPDRSASGKARFSKWMKFFFFLKGEEREGRPVGGASAGGWASGQPGGGEGGRARPGGEGRRRLPLPQGGVVRSEFPGVRGGRDRGEGSGGGGGGRRAAPASASAVASATAESRQPRALGRVAAGGDGAGAGG